jgi:hypothetical protein
MKSVNRMLCTMFLFGGAALSSVSFAYDGNANAYFLSDFAKKRQSLGITSDLYISSKGQNVGQVQLGLQYMRWLTPSKGLKVAAGYNFRSADGHIRHTEQIAADTFKTRITNMESNGMFLSVGAQFQRQFYKRVVLFAAVDLDGVWAPTRYYTHNVFTNENGHSYFLDNLSADFREEKRNEMLIMLKPSIGAKLVWPKFIVSAACTFAQARLSFNTYEKSTTFNTEYAFMNSVHGNLSLHYRF